MTLLGNGTDLRFARKVVTAGRSLKDNHAMIQLFDETTPTPLTRDDLKALALISIEVAREAVAGGYQTFALALLDDARAYLAQMKRQEPTDTR